MHKTVQNLIDIENQVKSRLSDFNIIKLPKIIAVSKTFKLDKILPLINHGHLHYGENKVQEAVEKWSNIKNEKKNLQLHMLGKLQSNKVKFAVRLFDYIHSVDNEKLAKKILEEQTKINKKVKVFVQVNIGNEDQKSGVNKKDLNNFIAYCRNINLDLAGLMCIPPVNINPANYFREMLDLTKINNFDDLSMGMSSDYLEAALHKSTYLRIGSNIFGKRY